MKNLQRILIVLAMLITLGLSAQVGINNDGTNPDGSAMLDVQSTDKGMLVPRMTTTQRNAIASPATGLLVFDTNTGSFWVWTPSQWHELNADGIGITLVDADGDTKVEVEKTSDEDVIHLSVKNIEGLQLNENGLFASGTYDFNGIPPVNGAGARMMWVPELAAFRVGEVTGTQWDAYNLGHHSSILGGKNNEIPYSGLFATIAGGTNNIASGNSSFLGSGQSNTVSGGGAFLGGGNFNTASGDLSVVSGGSYNTASGYHATIAGGDGNSVSGDHAASIGGYGNQSAGDHSFTGGGEGNIASSYAETVLGSFATTYTPASDSTLVNTDRLFVIGNGTSGANRSNALTLFKNGNVGLGTDNPEGKLHVAGDYYGKGHLWLYAFEGDGSSGTAYVQARDNSGSSSIGLQLRTQSGGTIVDAVHISAAGNVGIANTTPANKLSVTGSADFSGNVGIGTSSPAEPLVIQGPGLNNKWLGLKDNSGTTLWNLNNLNGGLHFVNQGADRLFLAPTGNVGIGTTSPTKGKVEITGSQSTSLSYGYLNVNGQTGTASGTYGYSLYASDRIAAVEFNAFSDARIKNILGQSNPEQDLSTLMGIEITDYSLIDTLAKGTKSYKKVIAQQVAVVYPQAVSTITDVVPDIYQRAQIEDGWIQLATDLKPGERVKIITEKSVEVYEVTEAEADRFKVSTLSTAGLQLPTIFVYGREVDDFHAVDYEAISMLNVSATQELARRSEGQQRRIEEQQQRIEALEAENKLVKHQISELNELKALVEQLQHSISENAMEANTSTYANATFDND